jgi:hypothetical protein
LPLNLLIVKIFCIKLHLKLNPNPECITPSLMGKVLLAKIVEERNTANGILSC